MQFLPEAINEYCELHSDPESALLQNLSRYTHANLLMPQMLSGALQGSFLKWITAIYKPKNVLEIGTYMAYSTLCIAEGLADNGSIHSIDNNAELEKKVKPFVAQSPLASKIHLYYGDALNIIPTLHIDWDMVFIDADKENYPQYFSMLIPNLRSGAIILADNVLWSGKVLHNAKDKDTKALQEFNTMIKNDDRLDKCMLPLRDGIFLIRVK